MSTLANPIPWRYTPAALTSSLLTDLSKLSEMPCLFFLPSVSREVSPPSCGFPSKNLFLCQTWHGASLFVPASRSTFLAPAKRKIKNVEFIDFCRPGSKRETGETSTELPRYQNWGERLSVGRGASFSQKVANNGISSSWVLLRCHRLSEQDQTLKEEEGGSQTHRSSRISLSTSDLNRGTNTVDAAAAFKRETLHAQTFRYSFPLSKRGELKSTAGISWVSVLKKVKRKRGGERLRGTCQGQKKRGKKGIARRSLLPLSLVCSVKLFFFFLLWHQSKRMNGASLFLSLTHSRKKPIPTSFPFSPTWCF